MRGYREFVDACERRRSKTNQRDVTHRRKSTNFGSPIGSDNCSFKYIVDIARKVEIVASNCETRVVLAGTLWQDF